MTEQEESDAPDGIPADDLTLDKRDGGDPEPDEAEDPESVPDEDVPVEEEEKA